MSIVGVIVEYNPLHHGHVYHFTRAKQQTGAEAAIAVMSGSFLQRGEPAIVSKWARAEMALSMGADVVFELPAAYAVQPAEWFAYGAVSLLNATGLVTHLVFGSEEGNTDKLHELASLLAEESSDMKCAVAEELASGASYPAAYAAAAERTLARGAAEGARGLLMQPNNSLGLHYMIALRRLGSAIKPLTIRREAAGYHDAQPGEGSIASATAIRRLILAKGLPEASPYMPGYAAEILARELREGRGPVTWESLRPQLLHQLLTSPTEQLSQICEMTEGLEYRIKKLLPNLAEPTVTNLLQALKTKRYTHTKLQRLLVHVLLGHNKLSFTRENLAEGPGYLRVLGFTDKGRELLKRMKKTASLPILTRPSDLSHPQLELDLKASAVYASSFPTLDTNQIFRDYRQPPIQL
ncbi:hypothetical protein D3C71_560320 [compost metagenome]